MNRTGVILAVASGVLLTVVGGVLWWEHSRHYISTEDAVVSGRPHPITVRIPGTVDEVFVHDNESVQKGQILFRLDDSDYKTRLAADGAILARTVSMVQVDKAAIKESLAEESRVESDLKRIKKLKRGGFSSVQRLVHLKLSKKAIEAHIEGLNNQVKADLSNVARRQAQVDQDQLNLSYTTVHSPVSGRITAKTMVKGLYVTPGTPLGYLVPYHVWVIANLKESDLTYVRAGDPVSIKIDAYPNSHFKGKVESIQQTTGAVLSLLPPENATGNFTKVVQRVPVRIEIDPSSDPNHLLRLGLSVIPTIHVNPSDTGFFERTSENTLTQQPDH